MKSASYSPLLFQQARSMQHSNKVQKYTKAKGQQRKKKRYSEKEGIKSVGENLEATERGKSEPYLPYKLVLWNTH